MLFNFSRNMLLFKFRFMVNVQAVLHGIQQLMLATGHPLLTAVMEIDHAYKSDS